MAENRNLRQTQSSGGSTPLAQEYAKRRRRKRKRPSKAMRYFAAILVIILVFFVAYSVGSWIIKNISSSNDANTENETEDPVTTLQKRLDELTNENKMLTEEIKELQSKVDKYNALYGPIDSSSPSGTDSAQGTTASTPSDQPSGNSEGQDTSDTASQPETPSSGAEEI